MMTIEQARIKAKAVAFSIAAELGAAKAAEIMEAAVRELTNEMWRDKR